MSHITAIETTKVKFMNEQILRQALQSLGEVKTEIHDYYDKKQTVDMSLCTQEFPRGIGFKKQGNEYVVMMDDYNKRTQAHNLLNTISQKYIHLYVNKAAQKQGFHTQAQVKEDGHVKVLARRYGR